MQISAEEYLVLLRKEQRIIGNAVAFFFNGCSGEIKSLSYRTVYLRNTTEGIGVLFRFVTSQQFKVIAPAQQFPQIRGHDAPLFVQRCFMVERLIESLRSAESLNAQRSDDICGFHKLADSVHAIGADGIDVLHTVS